MSNAFSLGLGSLAAGILLVMGVWAMLRGLPILREFNRRRKRFLIQPELPENSEAVLILQPGGRVRHLNHAARVLFGAGDKEGNQNLEFLTRRVQSPDDFLEACTVPGQRRLMVNGKQVQVTSYKVPGNYPLMLVSLRASDLRPGGGTSGEMLNILTDLSQAFARNLDLPSTLLTILENVNHLIPQDMLELKLWDPEDRKFTIYRLLQEGLPQIGEGPIQSVADKAMRLLEESPNTLSSNRTNAATRGQLPERVVQAKSSQFGALTDILIDEGQSIVLTGERLDGARREDGARPAIHTYLGTTMRVEGDLIGLLEIGQASGKAASQNDLELMRTIATQAALAIRNSTVFEAESLRAVELSGLSDLNRSLSTIPDLEELFNRLITAFSPMVNCEIFGTLLFNQEKRTLAAQWPFHGLPPHFIEIYQTSIPQDSPAEKLFLEKQLILTLNAAESEDWRKLGLNDIAVAASLRDSALIPMIAGEQNLGYLQISHHLNGPAEFSPRELFLLKRLADEAAAVIFHFMLIQESTNRMKVTEVLNRIAALAVSAAPLEEILGMTVKEGAILLRADAGAIFLLNDHGELIPEPESMFSVTDKSINSSTRLGIDDPSFHTSATGLQQAIIYGRLASETQIPAIYQSLSSGPEIESLIAVPLLVRENCLGEIVLISSQSDQFDVDDLQTLSAIALHLTALLENARLMTQTDDSLRSHVNQLTAVARVSRELGASLELEHLLNVIHAEGLHTTQADCGSILLFDPQASASEFQLELEVGCSKGREFPADVLREMAGTRAVIVSDYEQEGRIPPHPGVRAGLLVPILDQNRPVGAIYLHSNQPGFFTAARNEIIQTLAAQAGVALANARRFQDERKQTEYQSRRAEALGKATQVTYSLNQDHPLEVALQVIAAGIRDSTPFRVILVSVYEPETGMMQRVAAAGIQQETFHELVAQKQPLTSLQHLWQPQFKIGRSYFIPADQTPILPADVHHVYSTNDEPAQIPKKNAWDPDDFLLFPLEDNEGKPLGMISVDDPSNGFRPDRTTIESIEVFAAQAALVINQHQKASSLREKIDSLAAGIQRQQRLLDVTQKDLPVLLRKDLEQTISIHHLDQRAQRVRAGLAITESVSRQLDATSALLALGRETLAQLGMSAALLAENTTAGPRLVHRVGSLPRSANVEALFGQRNPLRVCLQNGEPILVSNLDEDEEWRESPLLIALHVKGFICLPLTVEDNPIAALLATSPEPLDPISGEDRQIYNQISRQSSIILQNISLLNETRRRLQEVNLLLDFSRLLSGLDTDEILAALLDNARHVLPAAHAGAVLFWNPTAGCLLPYAVSGYADNESMFRIKYQPGEALPGKTYLEMQARCVDEVNFSRDYALNIENLTIYRQAAGGRLPVSSILVPIITGEQCLGVLVLDNFNTPGAFKSDDQTLLSSLAQQVALSLENVRLMQATRERAGQLQALNEVAGSLTSSLQSEQLIATLLDQLAPVLPFDMAALWLREKDQLRVAAGRGYPETELSVGKTIAASDNELFNLMAGNGQVIYIGDVRDDPRFPAQEVPRLSWLGIPLITKGELAGVVLLEKWQAHFYSKEQIQVGSTLASQVAVALENARLYEESLRRATDLDQRTKRLAVLNETGALVNAQLDPEQIYKAVHQAAQQLMPAESFVISLLDETTDEIEGVYLIDGDLRAPGMRIPKEQGISGRVIATGTPLLVQNTKLEGSPGGVKYGRSDEPLSVLAVPMTLGGKVRGMLSVQSYRPDVYSDGDQQILGTLANQAIVAIQNARLFSETQRLAQELEARVIERTGQLQREQQNTETLLRILIEVSSSLDLERALNRTLSLLNDASGAEQGTLMLLQSEDNLLHFRAGYGYLFERATTEEQDHPLKIGEGLAGWVVEQREAALVADLHTDPRWVHSASANEHRSAIVVPMIVGEDVIGVLMIFHRTPDFFNMEKLTLVKAIAGQVAVAINNAHLYELVRDQAERLGIMLRREQEDASRSQAILEAVADGVLVTSVDNKIVFINPSAKRILRIEESNLLGSTLDGFAGLFGKAAGAWMETIRRWSTEPSTYQRGDTYAEQLDLEHDRIAMVHLAPVIMQGDFLGTVSIFRDITQQVEVDRLKSEFVATVSHELRTPMTSIKGYVDLLQMGAAGVLNENQEHFVEIVSNNINRLNKLLDELLDISRFEAGRIVLSTESVDLLAVAEEEVTRTRTRSEKEKKPMTFMLEAASDLPAALGDAQHVRNILGHLLDNAYNYTPEKGTITVQIHPLDDTELQVDIRDTGIGIPIANQERVFERFWRGEDPLVLATPGTGLGLPIVRQLVEMHNGRIWLTSSGLPGEGSTFSFTLPKFSAKDKSHELHTAPLAGDEKQIPIPPKEPPARRDNMETRKLN